MDVKDLRRRFDDSLEGLIAVFQHGLEQLDIQRQP